MSIDHGTNTEIFRKNLKIVRNGRNLTSKEVSERAGLRQKKRVADIEDGRGTPTIEEMAAICRVLEVDLGGMITREAMVSVTVMFKDWNHPRV